MKTMNKVGLLLIGVLSMLSQTQGFVETEAGHTVELKSGRLKGMKVVLPDENLPAIVVYRGISYASVRGGQMRFFAPTNTVHKWNAIKLAKNWGPVCPQRSLDTQKLLNEMPKVKVEHLQRVEEFTKYQSEECLNLNLYVPLQVPGLTESPPYAVVVLIHGDSYDFGTGNAYDGSVLASYGQVIVVTLNYRLGALGFLSTGDRHAAGNYALLDIAAALQWLKQNIRPFGGDPSRVTLLGQGTGAALVNILSSYAPYPQYFKEAALFRRIILQSGSALASWAVSKTPVKWARKLWESLNCSNDRKRDHFSMIECIKSKSADEIVYADIKFNSKYSCAFCPVEGDEHGSKMLPRNVEDLLKRPHAPFNQMEILMGLTRDEGFSMMKQSQVDGIEAQERERIIETYVNSQYKQRQPSIVHIVDFSYKDHERDEDEPRMRSNMMEMLGDGQFNVPMLKLANLHATKNKTYFYVFGYPSRGPDYPDGGASVQGDDLMYVMGAPLAEVTPFRKGFGNGERMISEAVLRYFTNFIKSGNPNLPKSLSSIVLRGRSTTNRYENLKWGEYNLTTKSYMHLGMRPSMKSHYRGNTFPLWVDLIPKVYKDNSTTKRHVKSSRYMTPPPPSPPPFPPVRTTKSLDTASSGPQHITPTQNSNVNVKPGESRDGMGKDDDAMLETTRDPPISMSLSITIAVGCSLLFLNIIVFAAVYYQKDKLKFEKKLREKEKERDRLEAERAGKDSSANTKAENETDSLLEEGVDKAPPTPQRNNSLPRSPLFNHVSKQGVPPPPSITYVAGSTSPEKLLSRTSGFTPSPRLAHDASSNRRSDSTDSGAMMHNGSDDAPVTMV